MKKPVLLALCLFGTLFTSACKKKIAEPDAPAAPPPVSSGAACATPLALAGITAKADLAWQQDPAADKLVSTVNYGNHSVLALSTQFNGDDLAYRVVSVNHPDANTNLFTATDGTQCAYVVQGKSNTGYVEISTLCAGDVYQIFLQTCNRNGDCSAEQALPAPYMQDRNRDAGVQSALAGVTQSKAQVDATATQAYNAIIAYLHAHKADSNPSPERKQFLSMAQSVENMGLDLYKVMIYTHYQDTLATVQANFHLADSTSAAAAPTGTDGCTPMGQIVGGDRGAPTSTTGTPVAISNAVGGSTPAATVTVHNTVSIVVTETETQTVTESGSAGLTKGQKAEIAVGSVFLFVGALVGVGVAAGYYNARADAVVQIKESAVTGEIKTTLSEMLKEPSKITLESSSLKFDGKPTDFKVEGGEVKYKGSQKQMHINGEPLSYSPDGGLKLKGEILSTEKLATQDLKITGTAEAKTGKEVKSAEIKIDKIKIVSDKVKVSGKGGGLIGLAAGALIIVGAILTAVGASGSGLADTGSTAEADLLTALSPLAMQQSSNLLQYHGSFVPVATAAQASTAAGKK